ncbi:hypothetical protein K227x_52880 [Rubripirellula lacrimiformis]|uniref:Uncharacterized protein n=1 Tax=Rubripirellula lacrimiformis TaxID=1930273 RepID=A0A517NIA7_9BACT|nr:hypothetical protein [Rubripirellula lacrimiformis]QDT06867.1 hypothetical protein K227x_52880 [Rubripirellula lacrimiformis]
MLVKRLRDCCLVLAIGCCFASGAPAGDPPSGQAVVVGSTAAKSDADDGASPSAKPTASRKTHEEAMAARKQEWMRQRRAILSHSSDLGIGASLGQNRSRQTVIRKDGNADAIARLQASQDAVSSLLLSHSLYQYNDLYGYRLYGRSILFDWHPPVVQQVGRRWVIRPGHFHDHRSHGGRYYRGGNGYSYGRSYDWGSPYSYGSPPLWQP